MSLAGTVTIGPKGQVVIPAEVREKMSIMPGDKLLALFVEDKNAIGFITEAQAQKLVDRLGNNLSSLESLLGRR